MKGSQTGRRAPGHSYYNIRMALFYTFVLMLFIVGCKTASPISTGIQSKKIRGIKYQLQLDTITSGYDGQSCWLHPRSGRIPGNPQTVVLTMQKWHLSASDLFLPINEIRSYDNGKSWTNPIVHVNALGRHQLAPDIEEGVSDFTPKWHAKSGKLLGTGHTVVYKNNKLMSIRPRATAWSAYDANSHSWTPWVKLSMPDTVEFYNAGAGSTQRVDLADGDILLPIYFKKKDTNIYSTTVLRCTFNGQQLRYVEHGTPLSLDIVRGLYEPSLTSYQGKYFLTMRNDKHGYVAMGTDGLHFDSLKIWRFDDGDSLGNYNTQQHWVTHSDGLFLVYTRKGANNDHVFRHRAPLFMAQVDPERLVVLRKTERVLVPNYGARLGNFGVMNMNEKETWVTTAEAMWPEGLEKYGANARVYAARILWEKPNLNWDEH